MSFPRPGSCPVCGRFVSVRTKHAYRCQPLSVPSAEVPWSGQSPMMAWPSTHRHRRSTGIVLSSPVEGIGPRLLVLLARHRSHARRDLPAGKKARYGPSHALQDLVELSPEAVLDEVLRPAPAWVPCGGTWHRVLLWDGELWAMDHGEIDVAAERVAAALSGVRLTGCVAALADWVDRACSVRLPWLETLASFEAASTWGVDELAARDCWVDARVSAETVASASAYQVSDVELLRWVDWTRRLDRIADWRAVGWTSREAKCLQELGLTAKGSVEWREAGLDVGLITDAMHHEFAASSAGQWWRLGFSPERANELVERWVRPEEAGRLRSALGSAAAVLEHVRTS